jgi:hypothetical protein
MLPALVKELMTKKVLIPTTIGGSLAGLYLLGRNTDDSKSDKDIQLKDQFQQPPQSQPKATQTTPRKAVAKPTTPETQSNTPSIPTVGAFLPELLKLYQLSNILAQQYEEEAKAYYQVFQEYSERLEKLIPYLALSLSKTPLGMMTGFDLPEIMDNLLKYYPWEYAKQVFPKVLTGYYILKANGHGDLTRFTIEDLIIASENPALAEATNQNWHDLLLNIAENYKLVMQSALDQVGKLKDLYTYRLNTLNAQAKMIKNIVDAILKEEKQNFEKFIKTWDMQIKELRAKTDTSYKSGRLALEKEKLNLKRQQMEQKLQQIPIQIERRK